MGTTRFKSVLPDKRIAIWLGLILCLQPWQSTQAQSHTPSADLETLISMTIKDTYNYKFGDALKAADQIIAAYPKEPEGYLYKCGVYWKMLEEGCVGSTDSTMREIKRLIDKACKLAAAEVDANPNDVKGLFYYAGSLVYRARYEATKSDWLSVMSDGIKTKKLLEKVIELDPSFYDACSGLGAFNYYAAHIPWYLKPLALVLGISGNEEEGIAQLKKAAQFGKYAKAEAANFLASVVYMNKEDYPDATKLMSELHQQYPNNLDFTRNLCAAYYKMRDYTEVIQCADSALIKYDAVNSRRRTSIGYIRYYRGASYERLNEKGKAIADFEMVIKLNGGGRACMEAQTALDRLKRQ